MEQMVLIISEMGFSSVSACVSQYTNIYNGPFSHFRIREAEFIVAG